jgi:FkbM family methyltransferase
MAAYSIQLNLADQPTTLTFELDETKGCQRDILQGLRAGQLYSSDVSLFLINVLKPGDSFIDIGANIGFFSVLAAKLTAPDGHTFSFEADTENFTGLVRHGEVNALQNFTPVCQPVSDSVEQRPFFTNSDDEGGHALWDPGTFPRNDNSRINPSSELRQTVTLDSYFGNRTDIAAPKAIKIDIEGAEELALRGAANLLSSGDIPFVICELHEFGLQKLGGSQQSLRQLMKDHGYDTFLLPLDGNLPKLIPYGINLRSKYFLNILFSKPEDLVTYWPDVDVMPGEGGA